MTRTQARCRRMAGRFSARDLSARLSDGWAELTAYGLRLTARNVIDFSGGLPYAFEEEFLNSVKNVISV